MTEIGETKDMEQCEQIHKRSLEIKHSYNLTGRSYLPLGKDL